jgi:transcriptional regulator with XRE-family HTH domain
MSAQSRQTLGEQIKQAVAASGKTVSAVARESGVPQPVLSRFVSGKRSLLLETAERLCVYLQLELRPIPLPSASEPAA